MAGPRGFEPLLSGSGGRRLNPDLATGPPRKLNINFPDKSFYAVGKRGPVAQPGWSVRLITGRSRVQISPGPPI